MNFVISTNEMNSKFDIEAEFKKLFREIASVKKTVTESKDEILSVKKQLEEMKKENNEVREEVVQIRRTNEELEDRINELEKYSRKNNVIINGIPAENNENVREILNELVDKLEVRVHEYEINAVHRLPASRNRIPAIIVKFSNNEKKQEFIKQARQKRLKIGNTNVYAGDHLMQKAATILREAKVMRNAGEVKYVWTKNGEVFVRTEDGEQSIRVKQLEDLSKLRDEHHETANRKRQINQLSPTDESRIGKKTATNDSRSIQTTLDRFNSKPSLNTKITSE